ncbi:hypothetical protein N9L06_02510 [Mariniblastus sp.]|nr:hypothetical protein [Mariniblastus sp.]
MTNELLQRDDFEEAVVGSIVSKAGVIDLVRGIVSGDDFADPELREFFSLLCNLDDLGKPVTDIKLVSAECKRRGLKIDAGRIAESFSAVPNAHNAPFYCERVAEASRLRKLAQTLSDANDRLLEPGAESVSIANFIESQLSGLATCNRIQIHDGEGTVAQYESADRNQQAAMTGLYRFDRDFGGFFAGELIVPAARLGTGKTALAWQIMVHQLKRDRPCLFVSLEMTPQSLYERHLASELGISPIRIRSDDLTDDQRAAIAKEGQRFREYPVSIFAPSSASVRQIGAAAKLKASGGGLSMLFVDYYSKIRGDRRHKDRRLELEEISRDLKSLALELGIPVVVLAQLNRAADESIPKTSQLAESDSLGRDADQVLLLHRKPDCTDLRVDKHRFVADDAAIALRFDAGKFTDEQGQTWQPRRTK